MPALRVQIPQVLQSTLRALYDILGDPDYNLMVRSMPPRAASEAGFSDDDQRHQFHWFIEIIPRIFERDGFQLGTSITKLSMLPDAAAEVLRAGLAARQGGEGNPSGPDDAT